MQGKTRERESEEEEQEKSKEEVSAENRGRKVPTRRKENKQTEGKSFWARKRKSRAEELQFAVGSGNSHHHRRTFTEKEYGK